MTVADLKLFGEKLSAEREYWSKKLAGDLSVTGLPLDFKRPAALSGETDLVAFALDPGTANKLLAVCGHADALAFAVFVSALNVCLHKYTGDEDIVVGTTIHERHREVASLNRVLALRSKVSGRQTARELLLEVKQTLSEAYAHQKYPFDEILDLLAVERPSNRAPLFNLMVLFDRINNRENVRHLPSDVTLLFSREGDRITGVVEFNPSLFKRKSLEIFVEHYKTVLRAMLDAPDARVSDIELLSPERKLELTVKFNSTQRDYPRHKTIHRLFEEQVERTPRGVAAEFRGRTLSYEALNARANRLARRLRKLGAGPGAPVAIYLEHSLEMLVALLGVLKAGAPYVPLDPTHPRARVNFMLEDSRAAILLTGRRLEDTLSAAGRVATLSLDSSWDDLARESDANPAPEATAEDLAYVIYTSGSTGKPKGVEIQHRALVNYVWWAREVYLRGEPLCFALYSSLGFDLTVTSIYTPLITGNRVLVYGRLGKEPALAEVLRDGRAEVLKLTPSHLSLMKEGDNRHSKLRRLIVGGEALETELARRVHESFGGRVELFNEYGPTEATVGCMIHKFDVERDDRAWVPIGRPAANASVYILDERLNPAPENVVGELYVAGDGLARGYLNRRELTEERFIADPFDPGRRMYRTGDVARWLDDGKIEYVGRRDEQVKWHGYRVELNEVRCALNSHPDVRDSVVMVRKDHEGREAMVGYYVSRREIEAAELRAFLSGIIIEETIPNIFMHLKKLPLTLNGKINYRALPTPEEARKEARRRFIPPQGQTEEALADTWAKVLGVDRVGAEDNFFELGGHSLLAAQIVNGVREALGVEVPLQSLFESPTVRGLARTVEAASGGGPQLPEPIERVPRDGELPVSFAQQRLWFLNHMHPGNPAYNINAPVRLTGPLNVAALEQAVGEVVRRHESLRTIFPDADRPAQRVLPPRPLPPLPLTDLSALPAEAAEAEAGRLLADDAGRPFHLCRGPLARFGLVRLDGRGHVARFTMHHIISDGWSTEVLKREVAALYEAYSRGTPSPLPELPVQCADYAAWQRRRMEGELLDSQLSYWKRQLAGAAPSLASLADRPRTRRRSYRGSSHSFALELELAEALRALSRREGVTLFVTLLAAFQALLHRYTGQDDIVVGSPAAERGRAETEGLIGCLLNTLVLRTDVSGNPTFVELLARVRGVTREAQAHQDVPLELVVEALRPKRQAGNTPLFQILFSLQQSAVGPVRLPGGLRLDPVEVTAPASQFGLALTLAESGGEISGRADYSTELFEGESVVKMMEHYGGLLRSVAARPEEPILDVELSA